MGRLEFPPIDVIRKQFRVDEHSRLWRKYKTRGWVLAAKQYDKSGYFKVPWLGKQFMAHRIIWALHHGRAPEGVIDHINGKPWDNRIENLREATMAQNRWNAVTAPTTKGYRNVVKTALGYRARVSANYRAYVSPPFDDAELAALAAQELSYRLHGEFSYFLRAAA